jgi:hypothetical protein
LQATQAKLANTSFVSKAPAEVVERQQVADLNNQITVLESNLGELQQG